MKLEDIGFYTLCDDRAKSASTNTPLKRCELILTDRCNFRCPYCRGLRSDIAGTLDEDFAVRVVNSWADHGLENIRFSGGEPLSVFSMLITLVRVARKRNVHRIAISTNGSLPFPVYEKLLKEGVNDFSISLDACCAGTGKTMAGGVDVWDRVTENIQKLSALTYVTVGVVLTEQNVQEVSETICFADSLGVSDIRVIPAAQCGNTLSDIDVDSEILDRYPILRYRIQNAKAGKNIRGLVEGDRHICGLVLDDMVVAGEYHFPCVIYMRERGNPIGKYDPSNPGSVRADRLDWMKNHNAFDDAICKKNCLDVCIQYNNTWGEASQRINP